jgi:chloramphenicol 3-O-phosphotransferase
VSGPIFLISGVPGAGKSTVARRLMERFPRGIHISVDSIRAAAVSGYADPTQPWTEETHRQFELAREVAAYWAGRYADAGFAVAIEDVINPEEGAEMVAALSPRPVRRILLLPSGDTLLHRNATRTNKSFDTSVLVETIERLHEEFKGHDWLDWIVLQTDAETPEETVHRMLSRERRCGKLYIR